MADFWANDPVDAAPAAPAAAAPAAPSSAAAPAPAAGGQWWANDPVAPKRALDNEAGDGWVSGALKGAATGVIKGAAHIPGFAGDIRDLSDYLYAWGASKMGGAPVDQGMQRIKDNRAAFAKDNPIAGILSPGNAPSGADIAAPALDKTGDYVPTSLPGRLAQTGLETAVSAFGPGMGAAKAGSVGMDLARGAVQQAPTMAAVGAGSQFVQDATDSPMAGLVAGVVAPAAAGKIRAAARPTYDKVMTPFRGAEAQEGAVGQRLLDAAADPEKLKADLQFQPDGFVPGSKLTTGQQSGDMGILEQERQARTVGAKTEEMGGGNPWNEREADQNAARTEALGTLAPDADPMAAVEHFKSTLAHIDQATDQAHQQLTQHAQAAAQGLDPGTTPDTIGARMRTALQGVSDRARDMRAALYAAVDPDGTLTAVSHPARDAGEALVGNHDPQFDGALDPTVKTLADQFRSLPDVVPFSGLTRLDSAVTAAMQKERVASGFGNSPAYQQLRALKSGVMDAINNAAENQVQFEALARQRGEPLHDVPFEDRYRGWMDAVNDGGAGADTRSAAVERAAGTQAVGAGALAENGGADGRLGGADGAGGMAPGAAPGGVPAASGAVKAPPTLVDFLKSLGGIRDQGGELSGMDLARAHRGLVKPDGLALDHAREAAAEAGYLGGHTDAAMANTTVQDLLAALDSHPVYSVHDYNQLADFHDYQGLRADAQAYKKAVQDVRAQMQEHGVGDPADRQLVNATAQMMVQHELPFDRAFEAAVNAYPRRPDPYVGNAFPGVAPTAREAVPPGTPKNPPQMAQTREALAPNFDPAAAERLGAAKEAHAAFSQTYRKGIVGDVLKGGEFKGQYKVGDSAVPGRAFKSGDSGYDATRTFIAAAADKRPSVLSDLQDYALSKLAGRMRPDGTLDEAGLGAWRRQYEGSLRAIEEAAPGWSRRVENAARAGEAINQAALIRKNALETFQKSAAAKFVGKTAPEEVSAEVGRLLKDEKNGPTKVADLLHRAGSDPDVLAGLRRAGADWIMSEVRTAANAGTSGQPLLSAAKITKLLRDHEPAISRLMGPEAVNTLRAVAEDVARAEQSVNATRVKGSPGSAKDVSPILKKLTDAASHHGTGMSAMMLAAYGAFEHGGIHGALAAGALAGAGSMFKSLRNKGVRRMDDMFVDALLNPERARYYVSKVPAKAENPTVWNRLGQSLQRELIASHTTMNNRLADKESAR